MFHAGSNCLILWYARSWRDVGLSERLSWKDHRAFMAIGTHRGDPEKEIVNDDPLQGKGIDIPHIPEVVPGRGSGVPPIDLVTHGPLYGFPSQLCTGLYGPPRSPHGPGQEGPKRWKPGKWH